MSVSKLRSIIAERLLSRLLFLNLNPKNIIHIGKVGQETDGIAQQLTAHYPAALIDAIDCSLPVQQIKTALSQIITGTVDLIFSNLIQLPLSSDSRENMLREFQRLLKPDGVWLFTLLGRDTLKELRDSFAVADGQTRVSPFDDMHDIGDQLARFHFSDPVMDTEYLTIQYDSVQSILQDLTTINTIRIQGSRKGLMGRRIFQRMYQYYNSLRDNNTAKKLPVTLELIYGYVSGSKSGVFMNDHGEAIVPIHILKNTENG